MNERLMRCAPDSFAEFLTAFEEPDPKVRTVLLRSFRTQNIGTVRRCTPEVGISWPTLGFVRMRCLSLNLSGFSCCSGVTHASHHGHTTVNG